MLNARLIAVSGAALLCAGCATWSRNPAPIWSGPPAFNTTDPTPLGNPPNTTTSGAEASPNSSTLNRPYTTNRPTPIEPTPRQPAANGSTTMPKSGRPETPAPYRPEAIDDELMRRPFETTTPDAASDSVELNAPVPGSTGFADPPRIPDPNALVPNAGTTASTTNPGWQVQPATVAANGRQDRTSAVSSTTATGKSSWRAIAKSSHGRALEVRQFGNGERHYLVMGSLSGNEQTTVSFVEALAELLEREPQRLNGISVLLLRTPNPDGLAEGTLTNSRGVALNRNFPSDNFYGQRTSETGPTPASEPETQALITLVDDFRPDRLIHLRSGNSQRVMILANAIASGTLKQRKDPQWMDAGEFEAYKAGSIEEYTTEKLRGELFVAWLPGPPSNWQAMLPRLAGILLEGPSGANPASATAAQESKTRVTEPQAFPPSQPAGGKGSLDDLFAPYVAPGRASPPEIASRSPENIAPSGKKGYVEILPPPPEFSEPAAGLDSRYFELPPPPQ